MFEELKEINHRPEPFEYYTADDLWTDEHTSKQMLAYHLNEEVDISSRKGEFINRSVNWIIKKFDLNENKRVADFGCGQVSIAIDWRSVEQKLPELISPTGQYPMPRMLRTEKNYPFNT
ncbi:MAG: hypothetical protein MI748_13710 [Opitutales bacterium]|nr:hypothetical protein [Opitutales bacterium]